MTERAQDRAEPTRVEAPTGTPAEAAHGPTSTDAGRTPPRSTSKTKLSHVAPLLWALGGVLVTLLVLVTARWSERTRLTPPAATASSRAPSRPAERAAGHGSSREQFAELYLSYLLKTYYVDSRGFCPALLRKVCLALHHAELLDDAKDCDMVPNDELVLAIGRYQHRVGLPVDGKAGPETVRMMLGGDFSNRRGMEEAYCQPAGASATDGGSPSPPTGSP